jgi:hypothetical protein
MNYFDAMIINGANKKIEKFNRIQLILILGLTEGMKFIDLILLRINLSK